jgi:ribosomal protein S21
MSVRNNSWSSNNDTGRNFKGSTVILKNGDMNKALRKLKSRLQEEGWHHELKKREHYVSKGTKRRHSAAAAILREKRRQKDSDPFA